MKRPHGTRRLGLAVLLASLASAPLPTPSLAQTDAGGDTGGSVAGAFLAIACAASMRVAKENREPIVYVVTGVVCFAAFVDSLLPDTQPPH